MPDEPLSPGMPARAPEPDEPLGTPVSVPEPDGQPRNLEDLDSHDAGTVMRAAARQVKILTHAATRYQRYVRLLFTTVALVVLLVGGLGGLFYLQHRAQLAACGNGNNYRAAQVRIWDQFIRLATQGNHDPKALAAARSFEAFIAKTDAPNNCARLYPFPW